MKIPNATGPLPTLTVLITEFVDVLITETLPSEKFGT